MQPNFLIIGAARSGTTTLYSQLQSHPEVYLPVSKRPEPHFFYKSAEFAKGLPYYEERFFSGCSGQKAIGEASTSYLFGMKTPELIRESLGDVKLICILRNPVERALSSYYHTVKSGMETLTFDEAIKLEAERKKQMDGTPLGEIAPFAYVERGFYHAQLLRWFKVFDRDQMKIVIFDDFVNSPALVMADIAQFLGISTNHFDGCMVEAENKSVPEGVGISLETRRTLCGIFQEDVLALSKFLGRDLSHWLRDYPEVHQTANGDYV